MARPRREKSPSAAMVYGVRCWKKCRPLPSIPPPPGRCRRLPSRANGRVLERGARLQAYQRARAKSRPRLGWAARVVMVAPGCSLADGSTLLCRGGLIRAGHCTRRVPAGGGDGAAGRGPGQPRRRSPCRTSLKWPVAVNCCEAPSQDRVADGGESSIELNVGSGGPLLPEQDARRAASPAHATPKARRVENAPPRPGRFIDGPGPTSYGQCASSPVDADLLTVAGCDLPAHASACVRCSLVDALLPCRKPAEQRFSASACAVHSGTKLLPPCVVGCWCPGAR